MCVNASASNLDSMPWWTYVREVAGEETNSAIGLKVGVTGSSVGRWATGSLPDPGAAARFAREYHRPVLEAFVAAGYLTPEEAQQRPAERHPITAYDDRDLVDEIYRRLARARTQEDEPDAKRYAGEKTTSGDDAADVSIRHTGRLRALEETQPDPPPAIGSGRRSRRPGES